VKPQKAGAAISPSCSLVSEKAVSKSPMMLARIAKLIAVTTRAMQEARKNGLLIDFTGGRRCKGILLLDTGQVVLSFLSSDTLAKRYREEKVRREREVRGLMGNPGGGMLAAQACL